MKSKIILFSVIGIFALIYLASAWSSVVFSNGLNAENLTFTGNQNITRNLTFASNTALFTQAMLNLSGFNVTNVTDIEKSYSCSGSFTQACSLAVDEQHYNSADAYATNGSYVIENVSIPNTFTNISWTTEGIYAYETCSELNYAYLEIYYWRWSDSTWQFFMYNNGQQSLSNLAFGLNPCSTVSSSNIIISSMQLPEVALNRTINELRIKTIFIGRIQNGAVNKSWYQEGQTNSFSYPSNISINIGNNLSYSYTGIFNQINNRTLNLSSIINSYLNSTYLVGSNYTIPFVFHSDSAGNLMYSDMNFTGVTYPSINLTFPTNNSVIANNATLNASFSSETLLTNATLYVWNSTGIYNVTNTTITGLTNSSSIFINFTRSDTYKWNYYVCNSYPLCAFATSNSTLYVDNDNPVINQIYPTNNLLIGNGSNVNFNCSATSISLDSMFLYGNFSGTYQLNKTTSGISNGVTNSFKLNLSDGSYLWTCAVNKTSASTIYYGQQGNYTVDIDSIAPSVSITSISTTTGSLIISTLSTETDAHLSSCKYSIYNSGSTIDGGSENVSFTCNSLFLASVTAFGDYSMKVYAIDTLGRESNTTAPFTVSNTGVTTGGGGTQSNNNNNNSTDQQEIGPNLEDNIFAFLSSTAFMLYGINITWFTLALAVTTIFIVIYSFKKGSVGGRQ